MRAGTDKHASTVNRSAVRRVVISLLGFLAVVATVSGCTQADDDQSEQAVDATTPAREARREVKLALPDWTGGRLNSVIAEILIERRLGYPVTLEPASDYSAMFGQLERGELDAALEIWPESLTDRERGLFESGRVARLGELGVVGQVGWFVPDYVVEDNPDLQSWEGFRSAEAASLFASVETPGKGRFLGTNPSYEQFDEEIIASLGLPFEVIYSGSEEATSAEVAQRVAARQPILLYWWTPTSLVAEFDLVAVSLPERTAECVEAYDAGGPMSCGYPEEQLFKASWPKLAESDPELHDFLTRFTISTDDQIEMIYQVESGQGSIASVSADWVSEHQAIWEEWFEPQS